jgi:multiple sugar transport system permease protein
MPRSKAKSKVRNIIKHIVLIGVAVSFIFPLLWTLRIGFMTREDSLAEPGKLLWNPTLKYVTSVLYENPAIVIPRYLMNSLIIAAAATVFVIALATPAAYYLSKGRWQHNGSMFFFMLTTRMGPPMTFALPFYLLFYNAGMIDTHPSLIIVYTFMNLAFSVWILKSFFDAIPPEIEESARVYGLNAMQTFSKISVPLALPGIIVSAILTFVFSFNEYLYASVLGRDVAKPLSVLLPGYFMGPMMEWPMVASAGLFLFIPAFIIWMVGRKYLVRGLLLR